MVKWKQKCIITCIYSDLKHLLANPDNLSKEQNEQFCQDKQTMKAK